MGAKSTRNGVTNRDTLRRILLHEHDSKHRSWRKIAKEDFGGRVKAGTLCRIARDSYEPRTPAIRHALGLPECVTVVACAKCGSRHDEIKTCPDKRKPRRRWVPPLLASIRAACRRMEPEEISKLKEKIT